MANDNNFGAGFSIDISNLKAGLATANKLIRESEAEFKAAAAGMDDWSESQEGLEKRVDSLNKIVDVQSEKVKALVKDKERIIDTMEKEGKSHEDIARAVDDVNGKIIKESGALERYKKDADKAQSALDKFNAEQEDAADEANNAERELKDVTEAAKDSGDGFTVAKGAIADFIGNGLSALASKAGEVISSIAGLADETREYRTELAKMETAAGEAGANADYIKDKWHDMGAVLGDEGAVAEGLNNLMAAGFTTQEQMDVITGHLEGAAIKWKDTLKFEGLADGLQETFATGEAAGAFGEMLERSGVNLESFNEGLAKCSTEAEEQNYVLQELEKLGLSDVSEAYREQNESIIDANKAQSNYTDKMAELGEKVEPITTTVKNGFADILDSVLALVDDVDTEAITETIAGGFETFIDEVIPAIKDGFQWVLDNKDTIISGIAAIGAGFLVFKVAGLINGVVDAFKAFKLANEGATAAQWLMNAAMNANPIGIIITLVVALVAGIVAFVATNDEARAKIVEMWEKVKAAFASFGEKAKEIFNNVKEYFSGLGEKAAEIWGNLKQGAADAWAGIKETFSKVASFFGDIFGKAWSKVKDIFSAGGKVFDGIKEGIETTFKNIVNRLIRGINKIVAVPFNAINAALTKIKNVEIGSFKPFADKISTITVPEIPELAKGGILTKATHVIAGEAGAEAVLPLEKNTGWMDMLAEKLASKLPAAGNVVNQTNHFSAPHSHYENYKSKQQLQAALRLAVKGG